LKKRLDVVLVERGLAESRAQAQALVIAGLVAEGITEVAEIHHIDRGYVHFEEQLQALGADVQRVESGE